MRLEFRRVRSEEHTSELQSHSHLVCRLLLEKKTRHARAAARRLRRARREAPRPARRASALRLRRAWLSEVCRTCERVMLLFFFFNDTATTEIYTLSLPGALPI